MRKINLIILLFIGFLISFNLQVMAEEKQGLSLSEQMVVLVAKIDALNQRIDDLDKKMDQRIDGLDKRIDDLDKKMDQRIDGLDKRISDLYNIVLSGFGVLFAGMFALIGFVIWDRRTVVAPVSKQLKDVVKQEEFIIDVLRRYSREEPKMAEVMRTVGL